MNLLEELQRRNVFRVGIAYVVAAWVIAQVADLVLDNIGAPDWVIQTLLLLLAIGFVVALIIAWAYEVTPDGIKRDSEVDRSQSLTQYTAKRLDIITIALLVVALSLLAADRLLPDHATVPADTGASPAAVQDPSGMSTTGIGPAAGVDRRSIAVLPFVALSADESDAYFGKGIAEELLNALAKFADLKVAARTSAFSFEGKDVDLREVGEALGVAHVLEGSVRRSGDRLRITAQLIRADDGFHLWSETYERTLTDIFRIQDEIVAELARVLQFRLGVGVGAGRAEQRDVDPAAYERYLQGLELWWTREDEEHRDQAILTFRRVTELDPGFADGWSAYAASLSLSTASNAPFVAPGDWADHVHAAFSSALRLDPDNVRAHAGLVFWHVNNRIDIAQARAHLARALALAPNSAFANYAAASFYWAEADTGRVIDAFDRALSLDPLNETVRRVRFEVARGLGLDVPVPPAVAARLRCLPEACDVSAVLAAYMMLTSSLAAGKDARARTEIDILSQTLAAQASPAPGLIAFVDVTLAFARRELGEPGVIPDVTRVEWDNEFSQQLAWQLCSMLARLDQVDLGLELLRVNYDRGEVFARTQELYALMPGRLEMPDNVRRDPRYHELWSLPGMAGLAAARRANGVSAGLPLPVSAP